MTHSKRGEVIINPSQFKLELANLKLPYTVTMTPSFRLTDYAEDIDYAHDNEPWVSVSSDEQLEVWQTCLSEDDKKGWNMCVSSLADIARAECVAAHYLGLSKRRGKSIAWVNVTASRWFNDEQIRDLANPNKDYTDALVITGVRWEGEPYRFDKAFDLLQATRHRTNRIVVGVGENPIAFMRKIGAPLTRAIFLRNHREVDLTK